MTLALVKFNLPPLWDGARVVWENKAQMQAKLVFICPPPPSKERCSQCRSETAPTMWFGLRKPMAGEFFDSTVERIGRWGRKVQVPVQVPAWPVYDLVAFRCPDCRHDQVWDRRTNEWWDLEAVDYTKSGSRRPTEQAAAADPAHHGIP